MGTVQRSDPPLPRIDSHIFLKEKVAWYVLPDDGAQRYDEFHAECVVPLEEWKMEQASRKRDGAGGERQTTGQV